MKKKNELKKKNFKVKKKKEIEINKEKEMDSISKLIELSNIYNSIKLNELAKQLNLSEDATEELVVEQILAGKLKATIDQVSQFIVFEGHHEIDEWEYKIADLLGLISQTSQMIIDKHPEFQ